MQKDALNGHNEITLRPVDTSDMGFLFRLYQSIRAEEMAQWGWESAQQEAFLRFQFSAQQRHYASAFPETEPQIVRKGDASIGSLHVAAAGGNLHLVDLSLLPEARGQGIGTKLLTALKEEAQNKHCDVTLFVRKDNPAALRLYSRLGFQTIGESDTHLQMRWSHAQDH